MSLELMRSIFQEALEARHGGLGRPMPSIASREYLMSGYQHGNNPFFEHRNLCRVLGHDTGSLLEVIVNKMLTQEERDQVFLPHELGSFKPLPNGLWKTRALGMFLAERIPAEQVGGIEKRIKLNKSWIKAATGFSFKEYQAVEPSIAGKVLALLCEQQGEEGYQQLRTLFTSPLEEVNMPLPHAGMAFCDSHPHEDAIAKRNSTLIADFKARLLFEMPDELRDMVKVIYPFFCDLMEQMDGLLQKVRRVGLRGEETHRLESVREIICRQLATSPKRQAGRLDHDLWLAIELMQWEHRVVTLDRLAGFLAAYTPVVPISERPFSYCPLPNAIVGYESGDILKSVLHAMEGQSITESEFEAARSLVLAANPLFPKRLSPELEVSGILAVLDCKHKRHAFKAYWRGQEHSTGHLYSALERVAANKGQWGSEPEEFHQFWYWRCFQILDQLNGLSHLTRYRLEWPLLLDRQVLLSIRRAGVLATVEAVKSCATEIEKLIETH